MNGYNEDPTVLPGNIEERRGAIDDCYCGDCDYCLAIDEGWDDQDNEPFDGFVTDAEADADALGSAGWGDDEYYGYAEEVL